MADLRFDNPLPITVEHCEYAAEMLRARGWTCYPPDSGVPVLVEAATEWWLNREDRVNAVLKLRIAARNVARERLQR